MTKSCIFRSQAFDYNEAKHLLSPDEAQALTVGSTPSSERCVLNNPNQAQAIAKQFDGYPGVRDVESPTAAIKNMENFTKILQVVFLILAVILLLSASVLILNTIRLAIFARRREVSVMKLVGATNWFIRLPFMFEGVVQGLLGAIVAAVVVVVLHVVLDTLGHGQIGNIWYQMRLPTDQVRLLPAFSSPSYRCGHRLGSARPSVSAASSTPSRFSVPPPVGGAGSRPDVPGGPETVLGRSGPVNMRGDVSVHRSRRAGRDRSPGPSPVGIRTAPPSPFESRLARGRLASHGGPGRPSDCRPSSCSCSPS